MPIDLELTPEQERLKETARGLAEDFSARALEHDGERSIPLENIDRIREAGLFGLTVPREQGGLGEA